MTPTTRSILVALWAGFAGPGSSLAQTNTTDSAIRPVGGTITGRVIDKATGDPLENARIVVSGTVLSATSQRGGVFTLRSVPPGEQVVVVSYSGFDSVSRSVQ